MSDMKAHSHSGSGISLSNDISIGEDNINSAGSQLIGVLDEQTLSSHPLPSRFPATALSLAMQQQEEQLLAEHASLKEQIDLQLRLVALQQQVNDKKAELDAVIRQSNAMSSPSIHQGNPVTPIHISQSQPVSRPLFNNNVINPSAFKAPVSAAALAKKQAIANLPSRLPSASVSIPSVSIKHTPPAKFTGDKESQNADVEQWIDEANIYLELSHVPLSNQLSEIKGLLSGYALKWLREKREEVEAADKNMTWEWLQVQLIDEFGRSTGLLAQKAEWLALRMGIKNPDGSETGGKSTYTVKAYTAHFTRLMRALTPHTSLTTELAIIDRYCEGVRIGYPALWTEMKGMHAVLSYDTLAEAVSGAQVAEAALGVVKLQHSSSSNYRGRHTAQANNIQNNVDDSPFVTVNNKSNSHFAPRSPVTTKGEEQHSLNAFVYRPINEEGRYKLTEAQQKMLYDHRRCYRCYESHARMGKCGKKQSIAPPPLN